MALPDVSRFASLPVDRWRALGARLRELGADATYELISSIGGQVFPPMCLPLRRWHLQKMASPIGDALRLLAVDDPIAEDAARAALGADLYDDLAGAGLFEKTAAGLVRAVLRLWMFEGVLFFADDLGHGGDAVMGPGQLTSAVVQVAGVAQGAQSKPSAGSALELGCGAAVTAICLARRYRRVVATDINPRAQILATVNAAINGVSNVEVRVGDLYAPVAGETFDLVVCQPPFIPKPDEAAEATYMYGGSRGDELPLRMIGGMAAHVADKGRGLVVMEWPMFTDEGEIAERVRGVVAEDANVLVLDADGPDLDSYAAGDTAYEHPDLGAEYARKTVLRREHLERLGVQSIRAAITVIQKAAGGPGWTVGFTLDDVNLEESTLDGLVASAELLARGEEALLAAKLRPATGVAFAVGKENVRVVFPPGSARKRLDLNHGAYRVVTLLEGSASVQVALNRFRKEGNYKPQDAMDRFLPAVEQLLASGVIEVAK